MFKDTSDLRQAMNQVYADLEAGNLTHRAAVTRTHVAKVILDTIKVEIAAAALGKQFSAVSFNEARPALEGQVIRRVA